MSTVQIKFCCSLLNEHFGAIVQTVALFLMNEGSCPLSYILRNVKESHSDIKNSLKILINHQFLNVSLNQHGFFEYKIDINRVSLINRYPKYIYVAKLLSRLMWKLMGIICFYNDYGEHIIEELLKEGQLTMTSTIERVVSRLMSVLTEEEMKNCPKMVHDVFVKLAETRFIQRSIDVSQKSIDEQLKEPEESNNGEGSSEKQFKIPKVNLSLIKTEVEDECAPPTKKSKLESTQPDVGIYWSVNVHRFHQYLRDMTILEAVKTHYDDDKAVELARIVFRLTETKTHPLAVTTALVSKQDICKVALKENVCSSANELDLYLRMFEDDVNYRFISKSEESAGGGMYVLNVLKAVEKILEFTLTSIVEDQCGSKMSRIFRLILTKKYLQQKQIEETAMIPSKDCKELIYTLFKEGFVKTLQYPKQPDYAPSRTYFVFTVHLPDLCRNLIEKCYRALNNAIIRRTHEHQQNKTLLERKVFIDAVIANLQLQGNSPDVEKQIDDLNQSFSTHDKEILETIQKLTSKLELAECQIDETLFILQTWLSMNT
ncbi:DNA-directed RNA polymerase III subunit RPC3-like protein [Leptotrombidium deliense]|uniref:DNA-directed RNA polymerase III subunit RPC3 n=1 Tax=Leptotrombidium deliense TaxID=299467 RepID=A0A443SN67_9ACAR|nr:DNA-directed RNA polymerase III subunit RPC3-like protein [Leptotrombidium deliense]